MIRLALLLAFVGGPGPQQGWVDLPAVFPEEVHNLSHPSERAIAEHRETIEARHEFWHRRHVIAAELAAQGAARDAPPLEPLPRGPSTGMHLTVYIPVVVSMGGSPGGMGTSPGQQTYSPGLDPMFQLNWQRAYGPFLRRLEEATW